MVLCYTHYLKIDHLLYKTWLINLILQSQTKDIILYTQLILCNLRNMLVRSDKAFQNDLDNVSPF